MTDFKVGDKVVGVKHHDGETGTVTEIRSLYVYVKMDGGRNTGVFWPEELKPVKPVAKFKVGDWVKVFGRNDKYDGTVGTVQTVNIDPFGTGNLYYIHKDDKAGNRWHFFEDQLVAAEPEFKVGDIVKVKPGGFIYAYHENKTLIVDGLREERSRYRYKVRALGEDYLPGHDYLVRELEAGEPLAEWEIELLDYRSPKLEAVKAAHPSNGRITPVSDPTFDGRITKNDVVNDPSHYGGKDNPYEVIKVAEAWGFNENAYLFNALKYLGRAGKKGSKVEDLKKLVYYAEREIALEEVK